MIAEFAAAPNAVLTAAEHAQRNAWVAGCIVVSVIAPPVAVAVWRWWRQK